MASNSANEQEGAAWTGKELVHRSDLSSLPEIPNRLYSVVADLQDLAPGRPFTPDGHLVDSIGEVAAAYAYDLVLNTASSKAHDATTIDGRSVQVKLTQGSKIVLSYDCDLLIAMRLDPIRGFEEIYNGPGAVVWSEIEHKAEIGRQRQISVSQLRALMSNQRPSVQQIHPFPPLNRKAQEALIDAEEQRSANEDARENLPSLATRKEARRAASHSTVAEMKVREEWIEISIDDAIHRFDSGRTKRCIECHGQVRAWTGGKWHGRSF